MGCFVGLELKQDSSEPRTHRDTSTPRLQAARNPVLCLEVTYFMAFQKCVTALLLHVAFRTAEQQTRDFTGQKLVPSDGRGHPKQ